MNSDIFREKLLNKSFTEEELEDLAWCDVDADVEMITQEAGEQHRWTQDVSTIFEFEGKYYSLDWDKGLTECQENGFYTQPYQVEKEVKTIEVTNWKAVS